LEKYIRHFDYGFEVHFPLGKAWLSPVDLVPEIAFEILFGDDRGAYEISLPRFRQINDFVKNDVIPRFASFFS
jgi:hypothetical protein